MLYLDSSAIVKLVISEPESQALRRFLAGHEERVASGLVRVEVPRALRRTHGGSRATLHKAEQILQGIALIAVDEPILRDAAAVGPDHLRSLDAVHLATALSLDQLETLVTYDGRLAAAAVQAGIDVASPA